MNNVSLKNQIAKQRRERLAKGLPCNELLIDFINYHKLVDECYDYTMKVPDSVITAQPGIRVLGLEVKIARGQGNIIQVQ